MKEEWQTKDEKPMSYQKYLSKLTKEFNEIKFTHIKSDKNQFVDALATLVFMAKIDYENRVQPISI